MKQLRGYYDLTDGTWEDSSEGIYQYESDQFALRIWGAVFTAQGYNQGKELSELYQKYQQNFTEQVKGNYIVLVYDKCEKKICIFHDRTTAPVTLYYTEFANRLYYSTSLKSILLDSKISRKLEESAVEDFIINGFLYGQTTLLENIFKIKAFHALTAVCGKVEQVKVSYIVSDMTKGEALEAWNPILEQSVEQCFSQKDEVNAPLSSGYDSSYIVHVATQKSKLPVHAFSIGGKFGKNELSLVQENAKFFSNLDLQTALTDEQTLQNLPDIVWRLEGAVYEVGLFLQYELNQLVHQKGKRFLICGECADQVMNQYYLQEDRLFPEKEDGKPIYYEFSEYPYIFGSYLILKKNGILANSFGIETKYPYLADDFISVAHALRNINQKDKRCHVANCNERLPKEVVANISKIGGATECHSLFQTQEELQAFFKRVESSLFYQNHKELILKHSLEEKERQHGIPRIKTLLRNAVLDMMHIGVTGRKQNAYFYEEMKLREYLCYAYLILFEKLFVSGEYDSNFENESIPMSLKNLL